MYHWMCRDRLSGRKRVCNLSSGNFQLSFHAVELFGVRFMIMKSYSAFGSKLHFDQREGAIGFLRGLEKGYVVFLNGVVDSSFHNGSTRYVPGMDFTGESRVRYSWYRSRMC